MVRRMQAAARLILLVCAAMIPVAAFPASGSAKICGRVYVSSAGRRAKVRVVRGPLGCGPAHREIAAAFNALAYRNPNGYNNVYGYFWRVRGWRCYSGLGHSETFCHRGRKQVDGSFRSDDGWIF